MYLLACVLGFSLERALESPLSRRLAENNEPCKESCDEGHDKACDQQDDHGRWTLSCDLHPTTSCDADCHYPPPPPTAPWLGALGTYPSPPPPPPPPDEALLVAAWIYFLAALTILLCFGICASCWGGWWHNSYVTYWCCCFDTWVRDKRNEWEDDESLGRAKEPAVAMPPILLAEPPPYR